MTISVYRTAEAWWAGTPDGVAKVDTRATTTAQLLADRPAIERAAASTETVPVSTLALLSPVTTPCRVVAQMTNFASHVKDAGMNPKTMPLKFFRKASGSITEPFDDIVKPSHVDLLDYEVEIRLVIGGDMPVGAAVTADTLADYVCGLVVTNDVSARRAADENPVLRVEVVPGYTRPGERGYLRGHFDATHLAAAMASPEAVYVCGPPPLAEAVHEHCDNVRAESFVPPVFDVSTDRSGGRIRFSDSGIDHADDGRTVLDQAEAAGLTPASGCRMGICHTCTRRKIRGAVKNLITGAVSTLDDEDVQICVSAPVGDVEIAL